MARLDSVPVENRPFKIGECRQHFMRPPDGPLSVAARCGCHGGTSRCRAQYEISVLQAQKPLPKGGNFSSQVETMNKKKPHLFVRDWIEQSFKALVDQTIREQRGEERRLAERLTTTHRLQARKSCIPDARSYRVARRLRLLARAQF
jgi:hypothetical protein